MLLTVNADAHLVIAVTAQSKQIISFTSAMILTVKNLAPKIITIFLKGYWQTKERVSPTHPEDYFIVSADGNTVLFIYLFIHFRFSSLRFHGFII